MDRELIERLWARASNEAPCPPALPVAYFADLVIEECAKACEAEGDLFKINGDPGSAAMVRWCDRQTDICAAAVRALK